MGRTITVRQKEYTIKDLCSKYIPGFLSAKLAYYYLRYKAGGGSRKNSITLFGHRYNGNLKSFAEWIVDNRPDIKLYYLADDINYYRRVQKELREIPVDVLCFQNPLHLLKVVKTAAVISSHGPWFLYMLKSLVNRPVFIDVWHGVGHKGQTAGMFKDMHFYDAVFVSSPTFRDFYKEWGFKENQIKVTGYARTDLLHDSDQVVQGRESILPAYGLHDVTNEKIILFAPTWNYENDAAIFPFGMSADELLNNANKFAQENNCIFLFRPHLNTQITFKKKWKKNLKVVSYGEYPDTETLLKVVDILVTDWSSIFAEFMMLKRPTIFLDVVPSFGGFTLPPEDRPGKIVGSFDSLLYSLQNALNYPKPFFDSYVDVYDSVLEKCWGDTIDGECAERYFEELIELINRKT